MHGMPRFALVFVMMWAMPALPCLAVEFPSTSIPGGGTDPKHSLNIVILGDGWTADDIASGKYGQACSSLVGGFFGVEPFQYFKPYIRFTQVDVVSKDHGCRREWRRPTDPDHVYNRKETYFGIWYPKDVDDNGNDCDGGTPKLPAGFRAKTEEIVSGMPCQYVVVLTPDGDISAGVGYNNRDMPRGYVVMSTYNGTVKGDMGATLAHELGHAMFWLADEYEENGGQGFPASEPDEANVSLVGDPKTVKWAHHVKWLGGPYEGARYFSHGIFRPATDCRMRHAGFSSFCSVCLERMTHRVGETVCLIENTEPRGLVVRSDPYTRLRFKVKCRGNSDSNYEGTWLFDGRNCGSGSLTDGPSGPTYEISFGIPTISVGSHEVRFLVADQTNVYRNPSAEQLKKSPNTKVWWLDIRDTGAHLVPGLEPDEGWE